jgi:hypothetical protein
MQKQKQMSKQMKTTTQKKEAYCAHCKNMGLSSYNTHYLRETANPKSRVVCPVLLNTSCTFCRDKGHTKSKCPSLQSVASVPVKKVKTIEVKSMKPIAPTNYFRRLDMDDIVDVVEDVVVPVPPKTSYASIVKIEPKPTIQPIKKTTIVIQQRVTTNWADECSSDEEDDDDEYFRPR